MSGIDVGTVASALYGAAAGIFIVLYFFERHRNRAHRERYRDNPMYEELVRRIENNRSLIPFFQDVDKKLTFRTDARASWEELIRRAAPEPVALESITLAELTRLTEVEKTIQGMAALEGLKQTIDDWDKK